MKKRWCKVKLLVYQCSCSFQYVVMKETNDTFVKLVCHKSDMQKNVKNVSMVMKFLCWQGEILPFMKLLWKTVYVKVIFHHLQKLMAPILWESPPQTHDHLVLVDVDWCLTLVFLFRWRLSFLWLRNYVFAIVACNNYYNEKWLTILQPLLCN